MNTIKLPITFEHGYHIEKPKAPKQAFVLLHGYLLDGKFMLDTFKKYLPEDSIILSPNAPFLIPQKKDDKFLPKYSWYFFDPILKSFYINYEPAAKLVDLMIENLIIKDNPDIPITLIGYSQGGYLSPKIAEMNKNINKVIGIACIFRGERFITRDIEYHQIHSPIDPMVNFEDSISEYNKLNVKGQYIQTEDTGHKLNEKYFSKLETLL